MALPEPLMYASTVVVCAPPANFSLSVFMPLITGTANKYSYTWGREGGGKRSGKVSLTQINTIREKRKGKNTGTVHISLLTSKQTSHYKTMYFRHHCRTMH